MPEFYKYQQEAFMQKGSAGAFQWVSSCPAEHPFQHAS